MGTKGVFTILRIGLGLFILYLLISAIGRELERIPDLFISSLSNGHLYLMGIGCVFAALLMGALRWHLLLKTQGISGSFLQTVQIFFIGQFFNSFMLGACGGDVARAYYIAKESQQHKAAAAASAFIDRAVGLFALISFCCVIILLRPGLFWTTSVNRMAAVLLLGLFFGIILGTTVLLQRNLFDRIPLLQHLNRQKRAGAFLRKACDLLYQYRRHGRIILIGIVLSLLNMFFQTIACWLYAQALHLPNPFIDYLTFFPVITVIASIPITPGALGVRESIFVTMFSAVHISGAQAIPLSIVVYMGGAFWSLAGGIVYLIYSTMHGVSINEELKKFKNDSAV